MIKFTTQTHRLGCGPTAVVNLLLTQSRQLVQKSSQTIDRGVKFKRTSGTRLVNIHKYLKRIGLEAKIHKKLSLKQLRKLSVNHEILVLIHHEDFNHFFTICKFTPKGIWTTNNARSDYKTYKELKPLYWIKNQEVKKFYKVLTIPKKYDRIK